ncbi:hypothetical protein MLD38_037037 [Melastoma candidum]|uniref:Uncharacterized protein n=1 Tax=Melastoma candidum TaxID=119954 RepID=A0ACB9LM84_9MYRT|nr:hypothetical protein MLD38_037037 [Melastoma candidum]
MVKGVHESSNSQFARLEEPKRRLAALNPSRTSLVPAHDGILMQPVENGEAALNATSVPLEPALTSENRPNGGGEGAFGDGKDSQ